MRPSGGRFRNIRPAGKELKSRRARTIGQSNSSGKLDTVGLTLMSAT